jgi:hypothetical protein
MEFPSWHMYSQKFPSNICPAMEFPSHEIYPFLWKFHVRITPPLGIPEPGCPLPWNFQGRGALLIMHG